MSRTSWLATVLALVIGALFAWLMPKSRLSMRSDKIEVVHQERYEPMAVFVEPGHVMMLGAEWWRFRGRPLQYHLLNREVDLITFVYDCRDDQRHTVEIATQSDSFRVARVHLRLNEPTPGPYRPLPSESLIVMRYRK